jgi:hypothetical protein
VQPPSSKRRARASASSLLDAHHISSRRLVECVRGFSRAGAPPPVECLLVFDSRGVP